MSDTNTNEFFLDYFEEYPKLAFSPNVFERLVAFADVARQVQSRGAKMMFGGNGASAAAAAHAALDFTKQGKVRSVTFHDAALMTAFANDYGYDNWMARAVEHYADPGDAVVLISVSGTSPSVVEAARYARSRDLMVVGFSGRHADNALAKLSDVSLWVDSHAYNKVENIHAIWLTAVIDFIIGRAVYEVSDRTPPR